jgi:signal transduction histidine kinase
MNAVLGGIAAASFERRRHRRAEARLAREATQREAERALLASQVITAEQDERRRLSLFLHDGPLQSLSGIALMHDAALAALADGKPDEAAKVIRSALERERELIRTLRDLSFAIEPVILRDSGFAAAVRALADQLEQARRVSVTLDVAAGEQLGEKAQVALYQTIREALGQAARRRPEQISVGIEERADGSYTAAIADDGVEERRQASLDAIRERARILNGTVAVEPGYGRGTVVLVSIPPYVASRR